MVQKSSECFSLPVESKTSARPGQRSSMPVTAVPGPATNPFHTAETLAVHLYSTHRESLVPDADAIGNGSALVLLVMVLLFNIVARVVGRQLTVRFTGKA